VKTYNVFGTFSTTVVKICGSLQTDGTYANGVTVVNAANPGDPVLTPVNWITLGYTDGSALSGLPSGGTQTEPTLTLTILTAQGDQFATVFQSNIPILANNIPFIIRSAAPTVPVLVYDAPRVKGLYREIVTYSDVNGQPTIISTREFKVQ
jgi:hypothetical protein